MSLLSVSQQGVSVGAATNSQLLFTTQYPFAKLDSLNKVSFQDIVIFFNNDPPAPSFGNPPITTQVYQFAHGYSYVPSTWFMVQFTSLSNATPGYNYENCVFAVSSLADNANSAELTAVVDSVNVTLNIVKRTSNNTDPLIYIGGYFLTIRIYVFVDDLLGFDVPSLP